MLATPGDPLSSIAPPRDAPSSPLGGTVAYRVKRDPTPVGSDPKDARHSVKQSSKFCPLHHQRLSLLPPVQRETVAGGPSRSSRSLPLPFSSVPPAPFVWLGAPKPPQNGAQVGPRQANSEGRQVGGPAPRRAPLPRRRVRRGCADPAPPAGPSGAAGSGQPLGTLRSPPRPRGGANRAGERAPPLFLLEPPGPVAQRT